jgi:hypothetical protein
MKTRLPLSGLKVETGVLQALGAVESPNANMIALAEFSLSLLGLFRSNVQNPAMAIWCSRSRETSLQKQDLCALSLGAVADRARNIRSRRRTVAPEASLSWPQAAQWRRLCKENRRGSAVTPWVMSMVVTLTSGCRVFGFMLDPLPCKSGSRG